LVQRDDRILTTTFLVLPGSFLQKSSLLGLLSLLIRGLPSLVGLLCLCGRNGIWQNGMNRR
jgi:hypothetical protein